MDLVSERNHQTTFVCANCQTDVTAFGAWTIARRVMLPSV